MMIMMTFLMVKVLKNVINKNRKNKTNKLYDDKLFNVLCVHFITSAFSGNSKILVETWIVE